jgi:ATP-dependent RNA helicase DeaD
MFAVSKNMDKIKIRKEMKSTNLLKDLGLSESSLKAINKKGFEEATEIQSMTIPVMLRDDTNIIAQAQTGTGKTAAFGLPLIEMIDPKLKSVQALILAPTRELAIQVAEEINSLKGEKKLVIVPIYGGQSIDQQLRRLKKGVHIVVGTPGRIIDHINRKTLKLHDIQHLILDEADEMLNMGFVDDMEEIMKHTNEDKRTLLFSATMPSRIKVLAKKYMGAYEVLTVKNKQLTTNLTNQIYFEVKPHDKFEALCRIVDIEDDFYGLVFCRTKNDVDTVASHLNDRGYSAEAIHGDISQAIRERTLAKFRKKNVNILVATDVAARGIDVNDLTHVINYALPYDPESYVHRIGRTGRAGKEGTAITFITPNEYNKLMSIQRFAHADIKKSRIPTVDDIIQNKKQKISDDLNAIMSNEIDNKFYDWAKSMLDENDPTHTLAAILNHCYDEELNSNSYGEIHEFTGKGRQLDKQGKARLFVALGKKDKLTPKKLVDLVVNKVKMNAKEIKDVQVMDNFSFMNVPFDKAEQIVKSFKKKGEKPLIAIAKKSKR